MARCICCCVTMFLLVMMLQGAALAQVTADFKQGRALHYRLCAPCYGEGASDGGPVLK
jgi:hypothetical protein